MVVSEPVTFWQTSVYQRGGDPEEKEMKIARVTDMFTKEPVLAR